MKRVVPIVVALLLAIAGAYMAKSAYTGFANQPLHHGSQLNRIVSLSPSVTETVFALGAGDRLVGVSRYCEYPPKAKSIDKVGGYIDPNFEAIVRLKPDIVIITSGNNENAQRIEELGIKVMSVDNNTISGIVESIEEIGKALGADKIADELIKDIQNRITQIKRKTENLDKPTVLISIGRSMGGGLNEVYVAGENNFYEEIISISGGKNAYSSKIAKTPALSGEGITRINPDVIIDLAPNLEGEDLKNVTKDWLNLPHVSAVKNNRVYELTGDYVVIPGPRFIKTLEDVAKSIHPDVNWSSK